MTFAEEVGPACWFAHYEDRDKQWRVARDARGIEIECETEALALSVARYRRQRLRIFR